jgi:hypothetical protein
VLLNWGGKAENRADSDLNLMAPICTGFAYEASVFIWLSEGTANVLAAVSSLQTHVFMLILQNIILNPGPV